MSPVTVETSLRPALHLTNPHIFFRVHAFLETSRNSDSNPCLLCFKRLSTSSFNWSTGGRQRSSCSDIFVNNGDSKYLYLTHVLISAQCGGSRNGPTTLEDIPRLFISIPLIPHTFNLQCRHGVAGAVRKKVHEPNGYIKCKWLEAGNWEIGNQMKNSWKLKNKVIIIYKFKKQRRDQLLSDLSTPAGCSTIWGPWQTSHSLAAKSHYGCKFAVFGSCFPDCVFSSWVLSYSGNWLCQFLATPLVDCWSLMGEYWS